MKKLILLLIACAVVPAGAMMQDRAKIDKAIKHYEDVQTKKEQVYRKALKEQEPLEAR